MERRIGIPVYLVFHQRSGRIGGRSWLGLNNTPTMLPKGGRQHRGCIISQAVTHSLVLLKMGKIIARNMLSD